MPRVAKGAARRQAKKRLFKRVKGFRGPRGKNLRLAKESYDRSLTQAFVGRRLKKRDFRRLWITRLSAACAQRGLRYSQFVHGLKIAQVDLNRKMLSEMAIHDPEGFDAVVALAKEGLGQAEAA